MTGRKKEVFFQRFLCWSDSSWVFTILADAAFEEFASYNGAYWQDTVERQGDFRMTLATVIERAETDLRVLAKALAAAGYHGEACKMYGFAAMVGHEISEKLAVAEARLRAEAALEGQSNLGREKSEPVSTRSKLQAAPQ